MPTTTFGFMFLPTLMLASIPAHRVDVSELLNRYAANQDQLASWRLTYSSTQQYLRADDPNRIDIGYHACSIDHDGERVFWRWRKWGGVEGSQRFVAEEDATYLSMLWDGETYSNYRTTGGDENGVLVLDPDPPEHEVRSLQYEYTAAPLMGYCLNTYECVDEVLRRAREISLREVMEPIHGANCYVIDAKTKCGNYTVWIDPEHGYNVARAEIRATKAEGHLHKDKPMRSLASLFEVDVVRFQESHGVWTAMEGTWQYSYDQPGQARQTTKTYVTITELLRPPDHEVLDSFVRNDVGEGTWGWITPHDQIKYTWRDGQFVPQFDKEAVERIDDTVATLLAGGSVDSATRVPEAPEPNHVSPGGAQARMAEAEPDADAGTPEAQAHAEPEEAAAPQRQRSRSHCGLFCTYALIGLSGRQVSFPDLVKPEYLGSHDGSTLWELRQAALDLGLHAEPAVRLTKWGLQRCPYPAILHVRSHLESPKYDHYELFLGVENGKARLYNPPQPPRLVPFKDLAPRWDGRALFVSDRPIDTAAITATDRQRWLLCGMVGVLVVLAAHVGQRIWLSIVGRAPRRWSLGLSAGQGAVLGLAALLGGGLYHFASDQGLLANAKATEALQKGHAVDFIGKVPEKKVRRLLGTETVIIDARLARDYEAGHLDGAISIPIDANDALWEERVAKIPAGRPILTYCQSAGCKYAEEVSVKLIEEGHSDISIFKGGWVEWVKKHGQPEPQTSPGKEVKIEDEDRDSHM